MTRRLVLFVFLLTLLACSKPNDPPQEPGPRPGPGQPGEPNNNIELTISTVSPDNAEGGSITITGTGFNSAIDKNTITIGGLLCTIESATTTELKVTLPSGLDQGDHDIVIIANNKTVTKTKAFHMVGWKVSNFAGSGASGGDDGDAATASFKYPIGLTIDNHGNLYVPDLHKIRKVTPQGVVTTIAGGTGKGSTDGIGTAARFNTISAIVIDKNNTSLYVVDQMNFLIRKIDLGTMEVITIAGKEGVLGNTNGIGTAATFSIPYGLAINEANTHLYVGDHANSLIRKIDLTTLEVTTEAGNGTQTSSDGKKLQAGIVNPGSMAFDRNGNLFITEKGGGKVRKMTPDGDVTTIGGDLSVNTSPTHIVADEDNNIYVTYSGMGKIKKYTPAGVESNFAGNNFGTGEEEGGAQTIFFGRPEGIVMKKENGKTVFYVADATKHRIKKIARQ